MTIVVLTDCPPKLRGDLTKWFLEINTGVYVGNVNARVRDEIWTRICDNIKTGRATMVFKTNNEQKMDFRIHNSTWEPVDYDGIKLIRRPIITKKTLPINNIDHSQWNSKYGRLQTAKTIQRAALKKQKVESGKDYCIIDIETTGLDYIKDEIIEIGALKVRDDKIIAELGILLKPTIQVPVIVEELTGITSQCLDKEGIDLEQAMKQYKDFIGADLLVFHNAPFDQQFLIQASRRCCIEMPRNKSVDILTLARRNISGVKNYKLNTLANYFGIQNEQRHRAVDDCKLIYGVYINLKEF